MSVFPQALVIFPGIVQPIAFNFTLSHGISPSQGILECNPQNSVPNLTGDLQILFPGVNITFPNCLVDILKVRTDESGMVASLVILDRRWLWRWPTISGSYNIRMDDGTLDPVQQMLPQDLATLCLQAMGETQFDVSALPNNNYPEVNWADELAARALQDMVERLGCRIVLNLDNSVSIVQTGVGQNPPGGYLMQANVGINPPETPDQIAVACGPSRYQADLPLQAVGEDLDGTIKPIDDLSYAPANGWDNESPPYFGGISDQPDQNGRIPREFAQRSVFRMYRLQIAYSPATTGDPTMPLSIPGYPGGMIQDIRQILPIDDQQVQTFLDLTAVTQGQQQQAPGGQSVGIIRSLPAWVYGIWYDGEMAFENTKAVDPTPNSATATPYPVYFQPFSIDRARGIVMFDQYVYQLSTDNNGNNTCTEADLSLRTAINVRNFNTWDLSRYVYTSTYNDPPQGTGTMVLQHDEIIYQTIPTYLGTLVTGISDNSSVVIQESTYYIQAQQLQFQISTAGEFVYPGIISVNPDGIIQQISWELGGGKGAITHVSMNNEYSLTITPYRQRRIYEDLRGNTIRQLKALASQIAQGKLQQLK